MGDGASGVRPRECEEGDSLAPNFGFFLMKGVWLGNLRSCSLFWDVGVPEPTACLTLFPFSLVLAAILNTSLFSGSVKTEMEGPALCNGFEGTRGPKNVWGLLNQRSVTELPREAGIPRPPAFTLPPGFPIQPPESMG